MEKQDAPRVSIVVPVYNEADNISILGDEINAAMAGVPWSWECVWVDDGSTDTTVSEIERLVAACPERHRYVLLARNFGQAAAMYAGFRSAAAPVIVTMDGDGQNDPADIPKLVERLFETGADLVNGVRQKRKDNLVRKISSKIANAFRNWVTGESVTDVGCSLRAFKAEFVKDVVLFKGMHRFLPTLMRLNGCSSVVEIPVNHRPRKRGVSKYGINNRLWVGLLDTFGIKWLKMRAVRPEIGRVSGLTASSENSRPQRERA